MERERLSNQRTVNVFSFRWKVELTSVDRLLAVTFLYPLKMSPTLLPQGTDTISTALVLWLIMYFAAWLKQVYLKMFLPICSVFIM